VVEPVAAVEPMMVLIGLISYPLYLWHWPLLCYLSILRNGVPNLIEIWMVVLLAGALSWLTFRFIETPIRRRRDAAPKVSFCVDDDRRGGPCDGRRIRVRLSFPSRNPRYRGAPAAEITPDYATKCFLEKPGSRFDETCIEQGDKPLLLLWGDSNAAALYPGLVSGAATARFRLARFTGPACAPILAGGFNKRCDDQNEVAFDFIKSSRPGIVLLHAMWDLKKNGSKLQETIRQLKAIGILRIVILGPVPLWKRTLPHELVNFYRWHHAIPERLRTGVSGPEGDEQTWRHSARLKASNTFQPGTCFVTRMDARRASEPRPMASSRRRDPSVRCRLELPHRRLSATVFLLDLETRGSGLCLVCREQRP
jgi:hypothetical protein